MNKTYAEENQRSYRKEQKERLDIVVINYGMMPYDLISYPSIQAKILNETIFDLRNKLGDINHVTY